MRAGGGATALPGLHTLPPGCSSGGGALPASSTTPRRARRRAKFLLESLADLRARLRERGSDLVVARGKPEEVLPAIARAVGASAVYAHADVRPHSVPPPRTPRLPLPSPRRPAWFAPGLVCSAHPRPYRCVADKNK